MKTVAYAALVVAVISLVAGIISRLTMTPITVGSGGLLTADGFLNFANSCFLLAIASSILELLKSK
jgi:hypothetical protein